MPTILLKNVAEWKSHREQGGWPRAVFGDLKLQGKKHHMTFILLSPKAPLDDVEQNDSEVGRKTGEAVSGLGHARAVSREGAGGTGGGGGVPLQGCRKKQCRSGKGNPTEKRGERKPHGNDCQKVRYTKEVEFFMLDLEDGIYNTTKAELLRQFDFSQFSLHLDHGKEQSLGT